MSIHTKVTTIAHGPVGMGQVWYRATGVSGVTSTQVAYRAGDHNPEVRRVRFVGTGATANLLRFRPAQVVVSDADMASIADAFSGRHLTHGVKTVRSRLSRIAATPVRDVVAARLAEAGLTAAEVFVAKESAAWWSSVSRAADRGRSVSMLTAQGVLRVARSHGAEVDGQALWSALGSAARSAGRDDVDVAAATAGFADVDLDLELDDAALGRVVWERACELANVSEVVGNAGYELTLTMPKSFSLVALSGDPARMDEWFELMEAAATHAMSRLINYRVFASYMFGRVWYSNGWHIPLEGRGADANFNEVQWRFQTPQGDGPYQEVPRDRWQRVSTSVGGYVEITPLVPSQPNLEFRLVQRNGAGDIYEIFYPPYTCGVDSCSRPSYDLLWSP